MSGKRAAPAVSPAVATVRGTRAAGKQPGLPAVFPFARCCRCFAVEMERR